MQIVDFLKYVLPAVPGCPTSVAKQAVLDTAIEFLTFSQTWDEVQDPVLVNEGVQDYDLDAPANARCIDLKAVYLSNGLELRGVNLTMLADLLPNWQSAEGSTPQLYTRTFDFTSIRVFPKPVTVVDETLTMHAIYTLKDSATAIPDVIVERYRDVLEHGAKYRLMVMPKTDWQDLPLAKYHQDEYESGKFAARITSQHGKTAGAVRARPRPFR